MTKELRALATKSRDSWVNGKWHTRPTLDIGVDEVDSDYIVAASPGVVLGLLDRIEQPLQPDCRTCANLDKVFLQCMHRNCTNANRYLAIKPLALWRTE